VDLAYATRLEAEIDEALAANEFERAEGLVTRYQGQADGAAPAQEPARSPWFRARYLAGQVSLSAGRLARAEERLRALLPYVPRLPAVLGARINLFLAEALVRLKRGEEAEPFLTRARDLLPSWEGQPLLWLRELRIRLWRGEVAGLGAQLAGCARTLSREGDVENEALLACEEGRAWDARGDLKRAEQCWLRADSLSRPLGAGPIRADVLIQRGRLEHLRGHLQAALDCYDGALACRPPQPQQQEVQLRQFLVYLELNQWARVRSAYPRVLGPGGPDGLPEEVRGLARMVAALLDGGVQAAASTEARAYDALQRGEHGAAVSLYRQALSETSSPPRQARLALALGELALLGDAAVEAQRWLSQAEDQARELDLPEVLWRALHAQGQLAARLQHDEERARRCFEEALVVSEQQARKLRHGTDAAAYHLHRTGVLRQLLHAACQGGDAAAVFRYQEMERGRLLLDLWREAGAAARRGSLTVPAELMELERKAEELARQIDTVPPTAAEATHRRYRELLLQRDRLLDDFLRDASRRGDSALPALPDLTDLAAALPDGAVYLAPCLVEDRVYLLAVRRGQGGRAFASRGTVQGLRSQLDTFRRCLEAQLQRYALGLPLGRDERQELDGLLDGLGEGPLGDVLGQALAAGGVRGERLFWAPDDVLHGVPLAAVRRHGRYLIEEHAVAVTFGGALLVHQQRVPRAARRWRPALVVTETPEVLPEAAREGEGVAATFFRRRLLHGPAATRAAVRRHLATARAVHFACHAYFDARHPLAASIGLPGGEPWRAVEWLQEAAEGLPLVTLSACRSAEVGPLVGKEVFGLVTGLLGSGVRAVLAGLWPIADREARPFMWRFYRHRLTNDLADALALTQRETLREAAGSPLFWSAFALFGDPLALPAPGRWGCWWASWRQRRHARRYPVPAAATRA
jgi:tetratricopeptide (TPR) repeat protein